MEFRLAIHAQKSIYDDLIVGFSYVNRYEGNRKDEESDDKNICAEREKTFRYAPKFLNDRRIDSYAVSAYIHTLKRSYFYRQCSLNGLSRWIKLRKLDNKNLAIFIKLETPKKQFLDYKWGERITQMALERREVDHAMSWLSTLGGAFSALGEHFEHCAQMAGKISYYQFTLALRLGDPLLVARCKLYAALSIIQRGNLRIPRFMIQNIYKYAVEQKDIHLQRMCQGVWAKLRYCYRLRKQQKKQ